MASKYDRNSCSAGHLVAAKHCVPRFSPASWACRCSVVKLDRLISSYLGETATNVRKIFEFARRQPCVLFFDELDALARSRGVNGEHNELRRVVNSLLLFIDHIQPKGFLIAATNLDQSLDPAVWRRFDEVVWFDKPNRPMIARFLRLKLRKNISTTLIPTEHTAGLEGYSYAEIERVCVQAIKSMIIERRKQAQAQDFDQALEDEARRRAGNAQLAPASPSEFSAALRSPPTFASARAIRAAQTWRRRSAAAAGPG